MTHIPFQAKNNSNYLRASTQADSLGDFSVNHALTCVAQEVAGSLQRAYPAQAERSNRAEPITNRAIELEYRQFIMAKPLTERELEVLQLIVDGYSNEAIALKLYISVSTTKTHVRNILKKLYASGRTQAAIRALQSGLVH